MARAFPASKFVGLDLSETGLARGRAEAAAWGLVNVSFLACDLVHLPPSPPFDVITAFDAVHDQAAFAQLLTTAKNANGATTAA